MDIDTHHDPDLDIDADGGRLVAVAMGLRRRARRLHPPDPASVPDTGSTTADTAHALDIVEKRVLRLARRIEELADALLETRDDHRRTEERVVRELDGIARRVELA